MPGLQTLYRLQAVDLEWAEAVRMLHEKEKCLGETEELRSARDALERSQATLKQLRARVRDLELELKGLTAKIMATEQRLYGGEVRNPKELGSLQTDLAHLRARRERLEDGILTGLTDTDESEARLREAQERWDAVHSSWQEEQGRLETAISALRVQLVRLEEQRADLRAALPASLLQIYDETCRRKGGRGIAAIRGGLCEGCRVSVPTSTVQQVRRDDQPMYCRSCGRILCVPD